MKILICHNHAITGGASSFIYAIGEFLVNKNHNVYLIEGKINNIVKTKDTINGIKVFRYKTNDKNYFSEFLSIIRGTKKLAEQLNQKLNFDIIHLNLTQSSLGILLSRKLLNIPKIYHFYGAWDLESLSRMNPSKTYKTIGWNKVFFKLLIKKNLQKLCLKQSQKIITLSRYAKKILINSFNICPQKIEVIGGGFNPNVFYPSKLKKGSLRKKLGYHPSKKILLIACRLEPRKGVKNIILALKKIVKKHPKTKLIIAFPLNENWWEDYFGKLATTALKNNVHQYIDFFPNPSIKKLRKLYQAADYFIMSSIDLETFGLTTVEALACGTPVLGTPTGATPEILKPLNKNLIFKKINPNIIAKKINFFLSLNKKKYQSLRLECTKYAKQYTWKKQFKNLEKTYKIAIAAKKT